MHRLTCLAFGLAALSCARPPAAAGPPTTGSSPVEPAAPAGDPCAVPPGAEPPPGCAPVDPVIGAGLPTSDRPELDTDGDGIEDGRDQCRAAAEDFDGYLDDDGCPEPYGPRETEHPLPVINAEQHPPRRN
ncbi:MAG: hypothetical protein JXB32_04690 [Deltaproteobacteria bacterium]|nr:hypothetical protein [Deltaproteobacteria bacterium]